MNCRHWKNAVCTAGHTNSQPMPVKICSQTCPEESIAKQREQTERDRALQAAARGEVYAPPGRCKGCGS
jgi:Pyruvate/2-oxoacid:ferredoxin oxidoreductase delta subunit